MQRDPSAFLIPFTAGDGMRMELVWPCEFGKESFVRGYIGEVCTGSIVNLRLWGGSVHYRGALT